MERALGIGGFFFRARDPEGIAGWYAKHLGIDLSDSPVWRQESGPTVFQPFREESDYFATDRRWMLNLRVADMPAMIAQLEGAGIRVETRADWDHPDVGKFARIHDPEGNPIELWEPAAPR